jgi:hypothetical protein
MVGKGCEIRRGEAVIRKKKSEQRVGCAMKENLTHEF